MNFLDTITTTVEALGRTSSGDVINYIICVCAIIISYLIGSIPFGVVIGKLLCHKDIREYGSKNIGSTNAIRVLGKPVGFLVFFFDVFKIVNLTVLSGYKREVVFSVASVHIKCFYNADSQTVILTQYGIKPVFIPIRSQI